MSPCDRADDLVHLTKSMLAPYIIILIIITEYPLFSRKRDIPQLRGTVNGTEEVVKNTAFKGLIIYDRRTEVRATVKLYASELPAMKSRINYSADITPAHISIDSSQSASDLFLMSPKIDNASTAVAEEFFTREITGWWSIASGNSFPSSRISPRKCGRHYYPHPAATYTSEIFF